MNYITIFLAILTIVSVFLAKFFNLSIIYPTLLIILTIIFDILVNIINERKNRKEIKNKKQ